MLIFVTFGLLVITILTLAGLRVARPGAPYAWLTAALGSLLSWASVFFWRFNLGDVVALGQWQPEELFTSSPVLIVDETSWLFALSLVAVAVAVILTSPARLVPVSPMAWAGTLSIATIGLLAVLSNNPLTLVMAWTAIDLMEFFSTLRVVDGAPLSERVVTSFGFRAFGTGFAIWAAVVSAGLGQPLRFDVVVPSQVGIFLLIAAGLRLGVLPLHLAYRNEPALRRGVGTAIRLTAAASSLVLLARIPGVMASTPLMMLMLAFVSLAAVYGSWKWLVALDELSGRPYWLIGLGALAVVAALRGNPLGSAAFGSALILLGAVSFLHSVQQPWVDRLLGVMTILLLSLPFTITATAWQGDAPAFFIFWPPLLVAQAFLAGGYLRHALNPRDVKFENLPRWAQAAYPIGLGVPSISLFLIGVWGWPGALQLGSWLAAVVVCVLAGGIAFILFRLPVLRAPSLPTVPRVSYFVTLQDAVGGFLWGGYVLLGRLSTFISTLLEGDGGLLWTLLLLVLIFSLLQVPQ